MMAVSIKDDGGNIDLAAITESEFQPGPSGEARWLLMITHQT